MGEKGAGKSLHNEKPKEGKVNRQVRLALRRMRIRRGMSVRELAERSGVAEEACRALEKGRYRLNLDALFDLTQALEAEIGEIWPQEADARRSQPTLEQVLEAVAEVYGIDAQSLLVRSRAGRKPRLEEARQATALLAVEFAELPRAVLARKLRISRTGLNRLLRTARRNLEERPRQAQRYQEASHKVLKARE